MRAVRFRVTVAFERTGKVDHEELEAVLNRLLVPENLTLHADSAKVAYVDIMEV